MTSAREELYRLIDQMPEEEVEALLGQIRTAQTNDEVPTPENWHGKMRQIRAKMREKYGKFPDSHTLIEEIYEERMDDIMGSSGF